jgi:hypothetical protein
VKLRREHLDESYYRLVPSARYLTQEQLEAAQEAQHAPESEPGAIHLMKLITLREHDLPVDDDHDDRLYHGYPKLFSFP